MAYSVLKRLLIGRPLASREFRRWWQQFLHNQTALWLKARLLFREGTVVTSVPAHVLDSGGTKTAIPTTTR